MRKRAWSAPVARIEPLLVAVIRDYGLGLEEALSAVVSHAKACRMSLGAEGWPYHGRVHANRRTRLTDLTDFAVPLGFRFIPSFIGGDPKP
jgi:hypothetical protein